MSAKSTWVLDPNHTVAEFSVRHMMIAKVKGRFTKVQGTIEANPDDLTTATIQGAVDTASVDTAAPDRDNHLRSADFFDVENHPELTFKSVSIERVDGDTYRMVGDLTMRGVTKQVTWDLTYLGSGVDPWGNQRIGLSAQTRVNRKDYGLNWNAALEAGGFLVGDHVDILVELQAVKQ